MHDILNQNNRLSVPQRVEVDIMKQELTPSSDSLMLLGLGWERSDPNRILQTFSRNYYRFHFITGGVGYYRTINETIQLAEGEGFIIFPGETPSYYPSSDQPWEYFWAAISGQKMNYLIESSGISRNSQVFRSIVPIDEMRQLLADMCATSIIPLSVDRVFPHYLRKFFQSIVSFNSRKRKNSLYFEQCLAYIAEYYANEITVQDIACYVNIDRTYLFKLFKRNLGISPQVYLLNYRIDKACDLLRTTEYSITDIAYRVGFRDYSDFSRQFKNRQKMSPTQYRQKVGKDGD